MHTNNQLLVRSKFMPDHVLKRTAVRKIKCGDVDFSFSIHRSRCITDTALAARIWIVSNAFGKRNWVGN